MKETVIFMWGALLAALVCGAFRYGFYTNGELIPPSEGPGVVLVVLAGAGTIITTIRFLVHAHEEWDK